MMLPRVHPKHVLYTGEMLIKENVSVLEDSAASEMTRTVAGNVAGKELCQTTCTLCMFMLVKSVTVAVV